MPHPAQRTSTMNPHALSADGFRVEAPTKAPRRRWAAGLAALLIGIGALPAAAVVSIDSTPLSKQTSVPGNLVLVPSVEWPTVVTQANDPGVAEASANYNPVSSYAGYFNVDLCYAYSYDATEANRYFYPVVGTGTNHSCSGKTGGSPSQRLWSGNYMNWVSMQAIDTFRLALTGGYRVHRPAEGTPPSVTLKGSNLADSTWATSEMANTTYLEKGNSDRWTNNYTLLRRLTTNLADATPSQATISSSNWFRTRIGGLRSQMWFIPYSASNGTQLGSAGGCCSATDFISMDVPDGTQTDSDGIAALPYDPSRHTLPNADNTTYTDGVACATGETGCTTATPVCTAAGTGYTWNSGTNQCEKAETKPACPNSGSTYYKTGNTSTRGCYANSSDNSRNETSACLVGGTPVAWTEPTTAGTGRNCTRTLTASGTAQYTHTTYGRNQIYAVSIRVKVCDGSLDTRTFCTAYGSNYKPEGLLQKNSKKIRYSLFSYLTESGQTRNGGVMRARQKLISPVSAEETAGSDTPYPDRSRISGIDNPEWDPTTGVLLNNPDATDATATNANIGNCSTSAPDGSQCVLKYSGVINYLNRFGQILTGNQSLKAYDNLSEMYYTALRYLRGVGNISSFSSLTGSAIADYQNADGMPVIEDWYKEGANNPVDSWVTYNLTTGRDADPMLYQCQTTVVLGIGDTATNSEDDQDDRSRDSGLPSATWRGYTEYTSGAGKGNLAGAAYWAHLNDIRTDIPNNDILNKTPGSKRGQTLSTYWVDVVELNNLKATTDSQYYNATKYGGYTIPDDDWGADGNASRPTATWFTNNKAAWSSAAQTVKTATGLGGTGDYFLPNNMYLANNGQKMIDGLTAAFDKIAEDLVGSGASLAANSTKLDSGTTTYQAVYYTGDWRGDLKAFPVGLDGNINATTTWEASKKLPAHGSRYILTCTGSGTCTNGVEFKTSSTFDTEGSDLAITGTATSDQMINYLRGESISGLRARSSLLGDIVNSQPVFVGPPSANLYNGKSFVDSYLAFAKDSTVKARTKVIYVAANDGMLHGFNAETGVEVMAYMPRAVIKSGVKKLAQTTYGETGNPHQFWNDGELVVADIECATTDCPNAVSGWATVLVGTTGRGPAKAVYALDVTKPADPELLWERSATDGTSGGSSDYIGQIIGKPVIARVSDSGSWAVLMGNGYNSTNQDPALLQFDLASGSLSVYETEAVNDNGLSQPAVWIGDDDVIDNVSTMAYAGDRSGKVWAFTLAASGGGDGAQIFAAEDDGGDAQPITAGLVVSKNPEDGQVWVFFGTGEFLSNFRADDGLQTWYGLIVEGADKVACAGGNCTARSEMTERIIKAESAATSSQPAARGFSLAADNDMAGKKGWYVDLLLEGAPKEKGERMVTPNQFRGSMLIGTSRLPTVDDPCNASGGGWIMAISPFTGTPESKSFFDINDSGNFTDDKVTGTDYVAAGVGFDSIPNNPIFVSNTMLISFDDGTTGSLNIRPSGTGEAARLSWRELVGE